MHALAVKDNEVMKGQKGSYLIERGSLCLFVGTGF